MRVIWGGDQLRQIGTTGKSPGTEKNAVKRNLQLVRGALVSIPSDLMTGGILLKPRRSAVRSVQVMQLPCAICLPKTQHKA
jgi:hypothetical protein